MQVRLAVETINQDPPALCGKEVVGAVEGAVAALGLGSKHMVSRAYHDSTFMAQVGALGALGALGCPRWACRPHCCRHAAPLGQGAALRPPPRLRGQGRWS